MLHLALLLLMQPPQVAERESTAEPASREIVVSASELLALSERALARGQVETALDILRALLADDDLTIRNEARFRLAMIGMRRKEWAQAGTYLRAILDEEPGAQRARLELARVQAEMGQIEASRRTLREAQAGGLPPEVARLVERFSAALRERKPFGINARIAFAPDSNINRATRSDTLGTVIGEFALDEDAQQSSGLGLSLSTEGYFRHPIGAQTSILVRGGISADLYRAGRFNDILAIASVGPEFPLLDGRATLLGGAQRRWFGGNRFYDAIDASLQWQRPHGPRSQLRTLLGYSKLDFRTNDLQDGHSFTGSVTYERAFDERTGGSITLGAARQVASDAAYSTSSGHVSATLWRDLGRTTVFASASYRRLEGDARLALYPVRRQEDFLLLAAGATFRQLSWQGWAPQIRISREQNSSPIEIYDYRRWRGEFGVTRAF
ncbi:porin family protein [Aurantiacibacter hainanensis]|uniref:porin family protein n=1 Tax=Aurantiacibacter hainanensis TaxID=3076114 RepID=UPI0030C6C767